MPSLRLNKKKNTSIDQSTNQPQIPQLDITNAKQVERLIKPKVHLWLQKPCECKVCQEQKPIIQKDSDDIKQFKEGSKRSHQWLKKVLVGLTQKMAKTLKLFVPDIMFVSGDGLEIFSTNKKDYRISKFAGTTPIKAIFNTMTRLRKQYKGMLEQNFRKTMIDSINPRFMHVKYYDKLLPSHFHDGDGSKTLSANKSKFKTYILHNNQNYIISAIQEHKMNEKEPFATLRYSQGNFQLLNQKQFQLFSIVKTPQDLAYVQSYIKSKESQAIIISEYTEIPANMMNSKHIEMFEYALWKRAEIYVMILLGGLGKYDQGYDQLQNLQDQTQQLMKQNPQRYAKYMTYQIVHFLSMTSNIYIRHIKIKWLINDIDNVYLQDIIQFDTDQISKRMIRYKLPPSGEVQSFYEDANFFVQVHKQMKRRKQQNLIKIKKQLQQKTYEELLEGTNSSLAKNKSNGNASFAIQSNFDSAQNPQFSIGNRHQQTYSYLNSTIDQKDHRRKLSFSRGSGRKVNANKRYALQMEIQNLDKIQNLPGNNSFNRAYGDQIANSIPFQKNKQSIATHYDSINFNYNNSKSIKTSRKIQNPNNSPFSTLSARRSNNYSQLKRQSFIQNQDHSKLENYGPQKRKSISSFGFGDIMTKHGRKLTIEQQKQNLYKSLGRYYRSISKEPKPKLPFGFHSSQEKNKHRNTISYA